MNQQILDDEGLKDPVDRGAVRFAGFGIRVGASILDSLVMIPVIALNYYNTLTLKNLSLAVLLALLSAAYKPFMEYYYGATVGKMIVRIRVVNYELQSISPDQSLIRYIPWVIGVGINLLATIALFQMEDFSGVHDFIGYSELAATSPYQKWIQFSLWIVPVSAFGILFNTNKQAVHDQLAKTYVIYR